MSLQALEAGGWPALPAAGIGALTWAGSNVGDEHDVLVVAHSERCGLLVTVEVVLASSFRLGFSAGCEDGVGFWMSIHSPMISSPQSSSTAEYFSGDFGCLFL